MMAYHDTDRQHRSTARAIERAIIARIAAGEYPVGTRLPSCEQLGRELEANKNTVSKVYRLLANRGYTASKPGQGTIVLRRPQGDIGDRERAARSVLAEAVQHAALEGMSRDELERLALDVVRRHFDSGHIRVGYADCTRSDARDLGRRLESMLSVRIEPVVVTEIAKHPAAVAARFDLLAVNLAHLALVERQLSQIDEARRPEVVPVLSLPDPDSLHQVARLAPGTRLLIVSDTEEILHALTGLARSFNPSVQVSGLLSANLSIDDAVTGADVVLTTRSAFQRVAAVGARHETIEVGFKLDDTSIAHLSQRLGALSRSMAEGQSESVPVRA
jgi:DNA-binding transcriptional regulator YhcF (GntR family)